MTTKRKGNFLHIQLKIRLEKSYKIKFENDKEMMKREEQARWKLDGEQNTAFGNHNA